MGTGANGRPIRLEYIGEQMSEVTVKDLRDAIEVYWNAPYYEDEDDRLNREGRRDAELAAFDAMAEKAEAYEKVRILLENNQYVGLAKLVRSERYTIIVGKQNFDGARLIEALKAVPK